MPASEECPAGKRARMRSLQHGMPVGVDKHLLAAGEIAPEEEYYPLAII